MKMKQYVIISGLRLNDANRGTAALGYGSFSFLRKKGYLQNYHKLLELVKVKKVWKYTDKVLYLDIQGLKIQKHIVYVNYIEMFLLMKFGLLLPFSKLKRYINQIEWVAAINGGDGFSDIYNTETFMSRLEETNLAMHSKIPLIQLPQTFGPFKEKKNYILAEKILKYSEMVFVRDDKFVDELKKMGVAYTMTKDLSAFMIPMPWEIKIFPDSIGLNVSGLCYFNSFRTLSGQFDTYPTLIDMLISHFQSKGITVYLIPHSYDYLNPEINNDDMEACRIVYRKHSNKEKLVLIDRDMTSPEVKYVISKMSFFIGSRMHANFAAIYSHVPLFGLAYSYKFAGAFDANGLDGIKQTEMINYMKQEDVIKVIKKIDNVYSTLCLKK